VWNKIEEIKGLEMLIKLQELYLTKNQIEEIKGLRTLTYLHTLYLEDNPIKAEELHLVGKTSQEIVRYCLEPTVYEIASQKNLKTDFVTVKGKKFSVEYETLDLSDNDITDISEIKGLEDLPNLRILVLNNNEIKEIKGLGPLTHLQELHLNDNHIKEIGGLETLTNLQYLDLRNNEIQEIKGLETLTNLQTLYLGGNPLRDSERHLVSRNAQEIVRHCEENVELTNERLKDS